MIGGIEGNGVCSSSVAFTAYAGDKTKFESDLQKSKVAIFQDNVANEHNRDAFVAFLKRYIELDEPKNSDAVVILIKQMKWLRDFITRNYPRGVLPLTQMRSDKTVLVKVDPKKKRPFLDAGDPSSQA